MGSGAGAWNRGGNQAGSAVLSPGGNLASPFVQWSVIARFQVQTEKLTVSRVMREIIKTTWPGDWEPGVPGPTVSFPFAGCARLFCSCSEDKVECCCRDTNDY